MGAIIIIIIILIDFIVYVIGFTIGKIDGLKQMKDLAMNSQIKSERLKMIIRSHRNMLLREETRLNEMNKNAKVLTKLSEVQIQLQLIRKIEEEIFNEM